MRYYDPKGPRICIKSDNVEKIIKSFQLNNGLPITVVNADRSIFGVISNGDLTRFLSKFSQKENSRELFSATAAQIANQSPLVAHTYDHLETIKKYLENPSVRILPIVNDAGQLVRLVSSEKAVVEIGDFCVSKDSKTFFIAEIGVNHNGELGHAKELIKASFQAGCHAVKFQHRSVDLYCLADLDKYDIGTQYIVSQLKKNSLSFSELKKCCAYAASLGLKVIITPFDDESLSQILADRPLGLSALKIASCDLTNLPLIKRCSLSGLPIILSTGMSYEREIITTASYVESLRVPYIFLHCNSTYPCPIEDASLSYISRLEKICHGIVGYSSHDGNPLMPALAVAHGAKVIEFHVTKSRLQEGTDHRASIEVDELPGLLKSCEQAFLSIGRKSVRVPSQGELANRLSLSKSFALKKYCQKGYIVSAEDLILLSPGNGFSCSQKDDLIGKKLLVDKNPGSIILSHEIDLGASDAPLLFDISSLSLRSMGYRSGFPVRYHDINRILSQNKLDLVEFHMSDRDLNLNPEHFLDPDKCKDLDLIVHGVEQYEDGFIFDLASDDEDVVDRSLAEIRRLVLHIRQLSAYFKQSTSIPVVLNVGGFHPSGFLDKSQRSDALNRCASRLNELSATYKDINFLPQTMPPFPWHQGGQSFHNILTDIDSTLEFLDLCDNDICLDVSHTALSCNYFNQSIYSYCESVSQRVFHVHLSDAIGTNAEGLEVGAGAIDFKRLHKAISKRKKSSLFLIPEIWQGHLDDCRKFSYSLTRFSEIITP